MADVEDGEEPCALSSHSGSSGSKSGGDKMFSLKKWNAVAMWSWDVECDTCAICRVQMPVLDVKLKTNKRIVLHLRAEEEEGLGQYSPDPAHLG
nr:RING-box protein 2 isoform X2 [Odocoileus virginianus texanus]